MKVKKGRLVFIYLLYIQFKGKNLQKYYNYENGSGNVRNDCVRGFSK